MALKKVLFVCMGNICRSPSAEAVFVQKLRANNKQHQFEVDSAGTHSYHVGSKPDPRSIRAAQKRGICMDHLRARQVVEDDFNRFDWLIVMDAANQENLKNMFPKQSQEKVKLMMSFASESDCVEVPDPYYGEGDGFELVLDLLDEANQGLFEFLTQASSRPV